MTYGSGESRLGAADNQIPSGQSAPCKRYLTGIENTQSCDLGIVWEMVVACTQALRKLSFTTRTKYLSRKRKTSEDKVYYRLESSTKGTESRDTRLKRSHEKHKGVKNARVAIRDFNFPLGTICTAAPYAGCLTSNYA